MKLSNKAQDSILLIIWVIVLGAMAAVIMYFSI